MPGVPGQWKPLAPDKGENDRRRALLTISIEPAARTRRGMCLPPLTPADSLSRSRPGHLRSVPATVRSRRRGVPGAAEAWRESGPRWSPMPAPRRPGRDVSLRMCSRTPRPESRAIPRRRREPRTIAWQCHSSASCTTRRATCSCSTEQDRPSAGTPSNCSEWTDSRTRSSASRGDSSGSTRAILGTSRMCSTRTLASCADATPATNPKAV